MRFRYAEPCEFKRIQDFYWQLIDMVSDRADAVGWKKGIYPADDFLQSSLERHELYVLEDGDSLVRR